MSNQNRQNSSSVEAFIDKGFPEGKIFCTQFLYSPEFNLNTLKSLVASKKNQQKYDAALTVAAALENQNIDPQKILLAFVKQPRKWLSLKLGGVKNHPPLKEASKLLTEFGYDGWYGPIKDFETPRKWYIRTHKVPFYDQQVYQAKEESKSVSKVATYHIRWTVLAEIGTNYIALSWNGFRHNDLKPGVCDPQIQALMQFPYWQHIPNFFDELMKECQANWKYPVLHSLVLQDLWNTYLTNPQYIWRHLRIRADNRGVALNAHSTGAYDQETLQMRGLQSLSRQLASSALKSLNIEETSEIIRSVESSLLRTLIQEWGTKSYEFSLDKLSNDDTKPKYLFRAHCYFANGPSPSPQDALQHLHCFTKDYGGSLQALNFLLSALKS